MTFTKQSCSDWMAGYFPQGNGVTYCTQTVEFSTVVDASGEQNTRKIGVRVIFFCLQQDNKLTVYELLVDSLPQCFSGGGGWG